MVQPKTNSDGNKMVFDKTWVFFKTSTSNCNCVLPKRNTERTFAILTATETTNTAASESATKYNLGWVGKFCWHTISLCLFRIKKILFSRGQKVIFSKTAHFTKIWKASCVNPTQVCRSVQETTANSYWQLLTSFFAMIVRILQNNCRC